MKKLKYLSLLMLLNSASYAITLENDTDQPMNVTITQESGKKVYYGAEGAGDIPGQFSWCPRKDYSEATSITIEPKARKTISFMDIMKEKIGVGHTAYDQAYDADYDPTRTLSFFIEWKEEEIKYDSYFSKRIYLPNFRQPFINRLDATKVRLQANHPIGELRKYGRSEGLGKQAITCKVECLFKVENEGRPNDYSR